MAFTGNYVCYSFKTGLLNGEFNFTLTPFYIALYNNNATLNANTTEYTSIGEVTGSGYSAGGELLLVNQVPVNDPTNGVSYMSFSNASWTAALTARGALIYTPGTNGAFCVLDFGADKISTTTFQVQFPAATSTSAILRLS